MRSEAIFDRYRFDSEIHRQLKVLSRQPAINTMITTALSTNKLSFKAVSDLESTAEQQAAAKQTTRRQLVKSEENVIFRN
jgi:hypothetical protein